MGETIANTPDEIPEEVPKLKDLLVSMRLPGDVKLGRGVESTGFPPEIRAELNRRLAQSARMVIDTRRF